jgi:hypothetical protein
MFFTGGKLQPGKGFDMDYGYLSPRAYQALLTLLSLAIVVLLLWVAELRRRIRKGTAAADVGAVMVCLLHYAGPVLAAMLAVWLGYRIGGLLMAIAAALGIAILAAGESWWRNNKEFSRCKSVDELLFESIFLKKKNTANMTDQKRLEIIKRRKDVWEELMAVVYDPPDRIRPEDEGPVIEGRHVRQRQAAQPVPAEAESEVYYG